jgi:glycosyltransferase involved in cell wall biosynthesis
VVDRAPPSTSSPAIYALGSGLGGESLFLANLSTLLNVPLRFFWDSQRQVPTRHPRGALQVLFAKAMSAGKLRQMRSALSILYKFILISREVIPEDVALVSSALIPIPRGKHIIARICTPPRILTIDRAEWLAEIRERSLVEYLEAKLFLLVYRRVYADSLRHASAFVTISDEVHQRLLRDFQTDSRRIYLFIVPSQFRRIARENFFLWVSRVHPAKRLEFAIKAFEIFYKRRTDFRLVVVGSLSKDAESERHRAYLSELVGYAESRRLPIEFRMDIARASVIECYARSFACLFTAVNEDLGLVPLEAMAAENPVISVNEGGPRETVVDGVTGYLVTSEDEMAERMLYLATHPALTQEMGQRGREHVTAHFSDEALLPVYSTLLGLGDAGVHDGRQPP